LSGVPASEVARSLYAVWRLLNWDRAAIRYFDGTRGAAIRSFWAAAIGAPLYAVIAAVSYGPSPSGDPVRATVVLAVGYVVTWTAFPLAMLYVADVLGRPHQYFRFLAAYNWATVLQHLIILGAALAAALAPPALGRAIALGAVLFTLVYEWLIARTALQIGPLPAAGVVAVDIFISLFIKAITTRMS
jgi:hypothetical protein